MSMPPSARFAASRRAAAGALLSLFAVCCGGTAAAQAPQYKRVHQVALRALVDGQPEGALEQLDAHVEAHGADADTALLRAVVLAADGARQPAARAALRRALALGLPPGRVLAEPRRWLRPLRDDPEFAEELRAATGPLVHGPTLGDLRADGVRVWLRTAEPRTVHVEVAEADAPEDVVARARATTRADAACTAVAVVGGLRPATRYRYAVRVGETRVAGDRCGPWEFTTARPAASRGRLRVAFGGGAGYVPDHERMWSTIRMQQPDLLLMLGDNIYPDDPTRPAVQTWCYSRRQSRPEWRELVARVPVYAIWDDHDFGTNDCLGGAAVDEPPWKPAVFAVFARNWPNPPYGHGGERPGCWFGFARGDVQFTLLDGRSYRVRPEGGTPTMLGPAQRAWFRARLRDAPGRAHLLCSPVPWTFGAKGDSPDTWNGFRAERAALLDAVESAGVRAPLLLSADRHRSDAWWIARGADRRGFYEFSSSRLTNQHVHRTMPAALVSWNERQSFGLVEVDTRGRRTMATYRIVDIDGVVRAALTVRP